MYVLSSVTMKYVIFDWAETYLLMPHQSPAYTHIRAMDNWMDNSLRTKPLTQKYVHGYDQIYKTYDQGCTTCILLVRQLLKKSTVAALVLSHTNTPLDSI